MSAEFRSSSLREILDVNFGTQLNVHLIEGVCLIGGPLNRGFTVLITSQKILMKPPGRKGGEGVRTHNDSPEGKN